MKKLQVSSAIAMAAVVSWSSFAHAGYVVQQLVDTVSLRRNTTSVGALTAPNLVGAVVIGDNTALALTTGSGGPPVLNRVTDFNNPDAPGISTTTIGAASAPLNSAGIPTAGQSSDTPISGLALAYNATANIVAWPNTGQTTTQTTPTVVRQNLYNLYIARPSPSTGTFANTTNVSFTNVYTGSSTLQIQNVNVTNDGSIFFYNNVSGSRRITRLTPGTSGYTESDAISSANLATALGSATVAAFTVLSDNSYLIGTNGGDLVRYDPTAAAPTAALTPLLSSSTIRSRLGLAGTSLSIAREQLYAGPDGNVYFYLNGNGGSNPANRGIAVFNPFAPTPVNTLARIVDGFDIRSLSGTLPAAGYNPETIAHFTWFNGTIAYTVTTPTGAIGIYSVVPEPGALGLVAPLAGLLLRRRR